MHCNKKIFVIKLKPKEIKMLKNIEVLLAPAKKLAELNKAQIEKAVSTQQAAAKEYVALTEARIKAVTAIKDVAGLNAFVKEQVELAQSGFDKVVADSKTLVADAKAYNEDVIKLVQEGNAVVTKEVKATVKKVAKKAA
jgi:phasin family protein